ncbi:branched-chain amino acid ABC transporter substrate-binding protein [Halobacteriales archaeon QS_4_70_19]|nr:MAG: branched-chain amino acid ABC transporter substrate-binding protein [Halobacteriales archaeon QS_4_70_19]
MAGLAGCTQGGDGGDGGDGGGGGGGNQYPSIGNFPVEGDEVVIGFNVPQSGPYSAEGQDELRGYNLAKEHLNNGGGWVDQWDELSSGGILDKTVASVEGDTGTNPEQATQQARRMINQDNAMMISGGSSSAVAIAVQKLCQEQKVQFQCCLTHSNDTTGKSCVRYSTREVFNAFMTGAALAPILNDEYGSNLNFYQLYADYTWGQTVQSSMNKFLTESGWSQIDSVPTPLDTSDYSSFLSDVPREETDVLILAHYGLDAANSLPQAVNQGLDEDMEIVVPLYNRLMAKASGEAINGVFGTVDWNWQYDNPATNSFVEAYKSEHDRNPSYTARLAYNATMQYAAACERAGTFYPPEVLKELEGHTYSNAGLGTEEELRACDHQAMRPVQVVRGNVQGEDEFFELVNQTPTSEVEYACDAGPAAQCNLGPYE